MKDVRDSNDDGFNNLNHLNGWMVDIMGGGIWVMESSLMDNYARNWDKLSISTEVHGNFFPFAFLDGIVSIFWYESCLLLIAILHKRMNVKKCIQNFYSSK